MLNGITLMMAESTMEGRLFDLDMQLLVDAMIMMPAILALFAILSYLLFNPARELLRKRREKIQTDLETAATDKEEAARLKAEYTYKIEQIQKEADEILSDARRKALQNEAKIIQEAKEEVARIMARSNTEIELDKKKAMDDIKKEMIVIASLIAQKVVAANIDTTIQNQLIDETMKEIGDGTWLS